VSDAEKPGLTENRPAGPTVIDTGRGPSVFYKNRHLYSRIDPAKNSLLAARQSVIREETLVLAVSPLLGYGLDILLEKLPASSFILAVEEDENLMAFSAARIPRQTLSHKSLKYIRTSSTARVLETLQGLDAGPFRRCLRIDLSGGSALNARFYAETAGAIEQYISRWWRNHLTLMKLGRNYARNLFRNCLSLPRSLPLPSHSVDRTVFVAGAGPSLAAALPFIRERRESLFLLSVDTALPALGDAGITPDAAVLVESQFWIERAFTGFAGSRIPVYADLTARPNAVSAPGGEVRFFFSEYTGAVFIDRFLASGLPPLVIPPLGSVGLVALYLAREIAAPGIPVLFSGLDFSFGKGFTHSRGAAPARETLNTATRLTPPGSSMPSTAAGIFAAAGKRGETVHTDPSLSGYAELCRSYFGADDSGGKGLFFDLGETGLATGCMPLSFADATLLCAQTPTDAGTMPAPPTAGNVSALGRSPAAGTVRDFLDREIEMIEELKGILTGRLAPENAGGRIAFLVQELDYLHIHFPDAYRADVRDTGFLKRIRVELDYFLKTLNSAFSFPWS